MKVVKTKKNVTFWFFMLSVLFSNAQKISGTIKEFNSNKVIASANILVKELNNPQHIIDFKVVYNGKFSFILKEPNKPVLIEIKSYGYKSYEYVIKNTKPPKNYNLTIRMLKDTALALDEVVVVAKKKFEVKKDTIIYNVEAYKNGTERKIIDLLENLPGIEVNNETGRIRYNGKPIETVLLDGDNLFGNNYTLGTKNINVDIVSSVQAIENFSENYLLKDIKGNEDKVALNLTLKKGVIDFSGSTVLSLGAFSTGETALNTNSNILGIKQGYKSFATLAYNNVGVNYGPNNYYSASINLEAIFEKDYFAQKIIPETYFSNVLDGERVNINNQFFGNYNANFSINKRLKVRTTLYYINDKITSEKFIENQYLIDEESFTTTDSYSVDKKPVQYRGDVEIKYNASKTSLLEYSLKVQQEGVATNATVTSNNLNSFNSKLNSEDFYLKNKLLYTQKVNDSKVVQVSLKQSTSSINQLFKINSTESNESNLDSNVQDITTGRNYIELQSVMLGKTAKSNKYTFSVGGILDDNSIQSELFQMNSNNSLIEEDTKNDLKYARAKLYQNTTYSFNIGRWKFSPTLLFSYLKQQLNENLADTRVIQEDFITKPSLNIKYAISKNSFLFGEINYNKIPTVEDYLFKNIILINNRQVKSNSPSLELQKRLNYELYYSKNDLFNQFQINGGVSYQKSNGNFFSNASINENFTFTNYFYLSQNSNTTNFNFLVAKYIPFLESTLKISSNYGVSTYKNVVNNSDIRTNKSKFLNTRFYLKTSFDGIVNFKNVLNVSNFISKSENENEFTNQGLNNSFKVLIKPSQKTLLELTTDYFLPNSNKTSENYLFLDVLVHYKLKQNKFEFSLSGKNLLNELNFEQVQTTDISTNIYRTNILPAHLMFSAMFNF